MGESQLYLIQQFSLFEPAHVFFALQALCYHRGQIFYSGYPSACPVDSYYLLTEKNLSSFLAQQVIFLQFSPRSSYPVQSASSVRSIQNDLYCLHAWFVRIYSVLCRFFSSADSGPCSDPSLGFPSDYLL